MTEGDKALVEKLGLLVNSDHVETFSQQTLTRIGVLAQKKATSHDASEDYDILQMLMETLLKISQTETGKVALAQHKGILRGLLEVARNLRYMLQTVVSNEEKNEPGLLTLVLSLPTLFSEEIRYSTQEILVEVLVRLYHVFSKDEDKDATCAKKFDDLKSALPAVLLEALQDPRRGVKGVLSNMRPLLMVINTNNPHLLSVPVEDMVYMMPWKVRGTAPNTKKKQKSAGIKKGKGRKRIGEDREGSDDEQEEGGQVCRKTLGEVGWLDINVESLSVFVTIEGNFQTPESITLLTMEYDNIAGVHFEDSEKTSMGVTSEVKIQGPPVMQVVLSQMTDNLTSLVGESADLPPPLPPGFTLKPGESKGGGMPILRLYFESLQGYIAAKVAVEKRIAQATDRAQQHQEMFQKRRTNEDVYGNRDTQRSQLSALQGKGGGEAKVAVAQRRSKLSVASTRDTGQRDEAVQRALYLEIQGEDEGTQEQSKQLDDESGGDGGSEVYSLAQRDAVTAPIRPLLSLPLSARDDRKEEGGDLDEEEFRLDSQDLTSSLDLEVGEESKISTETAHESVVADISVHRRNLKTSIQRKESFPFPSKDTDSFTSRRIHKKSSAVGLTPSPLNKKRKAGEEKADDEGGNGEESRDTEKKQMGQKRMKYKDEEKKLKQVPPKKTLRSHDVTAQASNFSPDLAPDAPSSARVLRSRRQKQPSAASYSSLSPKLLSRGRKQAQAQAQTVAATAATGTVTSPLIEAISSAPRKAVKPAIHPLETRGKRQVKGHAAAMAAVAAMAEADDSLSAAAARASLSPHLPLQEGDAVEGEEGRKKGGEDLSQGKPRRRSIGGGGGSRYTKRPLKLLHIKASTATTISGTTASTHFSRNGHISSGEKSSVSLRDRPVAISKKKKAMKATVSAATRAAVLSRSRRKGRSENVNSGSEGSIAGSQASAAQQRGPKQRQKSESTLLVMRQSLSSAHQPARQSRGGGGKRGSVGGSVYSLSEAEMEEEERLRALEQEKDAAFGEEILRSTKEYKGAVEGDPGRRSAMKTAVSAKAKRTTSTSSTPLPPSLCSIISYQPSPPDFSVAAQDQEFDEEGYKGHTAIQSRSVFASSAEGESEAYESLLDEERSVSSVYVSGDEQGKEVGGARGCSFKHTDASAGAAERGARGRERTPSIRETVAANSALAISSTSEPKRHYPRLALQVTPARRQAAEAVQALWQEEGGEAEDQSDHLIASLMEELQQIRDARQARKQHSRAEKICNIALDQITQYISSWGNYYYLTYQLPLPSILENGEDEEVGEEGKVIRSKLRVIQEEVESTVANWEEATKSLSERERVLEDDMEGALQRLRGFKEDIRLAEAALDKDQKHLSHVELPGIRDAYIEHFLQAVSEVVPHHHHGRPRGEAFSHTVLQESLAAPLQLPAQAGSRSHLLSRPPCPGQYTEALHKRTPARHKKSSRNREKVVQAEADVYEGAENIPRQLLSKQRRRGERKQVS